MAAARFTVTRARDDEEIPITGSDGGYGALPGSGHIQEGGESWFPVGSGEMEKGDNIQERIYVGTIGLLRIHL